MKRLLINIGFCLFFIQCFSQRLSVTNLRCAYLPNPLGVDLPRPPLSWEIVNTQRNILQTAYRVLVADDSAGLDKGIGNIWDSKKINSSASLQVQYNGKPLQSAKKYFWKVMTWDNKGNQSAWSNISMWQMGLLQRSDWRHAQWICYEEIIDSLLIAPHVHLNGKRSWGPRRNVLPLMRKEFGINKPVRNATAFICGLGQFEMYINGKKIGDHFLDPGWTNYSKTAQYVTFDISQQIQQGKNAIGIILGNGFYYIPGQRYRKMTGAYGQPKMIMRMLIEYMDGSFEDIISDETWKTDPSPIIFSSIYGGEDYDGYLEQHGWDKAYFHETGWKDVIITDGPSLLEAELQEPIKVMESFSVKTEKQIRPNVWMYDLGQNFSGIPAITVSGNRGDSIKIFCAELINADGTANQRATGSPSYFTYILKGSAEETWQPRFSYTGFRYMEVHCIAKDSLKPAPVIKNIEGLHIRNVAASAGTFNCSNELFNKTNTLIDWAIKSNMVSVFTDCPHREKLGWLEQTHLMGASVQYAYDVAGLCRKAIKDMMSSQYENGKIPEIAPEFTLFSPPFDESPEWGSAAIILPWYNYQWYADRETLATAYDMMKKYVLYLRTRANDNILSFGLGDWYDIGPQRPGVSQMTTMGVTGTATYYYDLTIMAQVSKILNRNGDQRMFEQLAVDVKRSFNQHFFDEKKGKYDSASQTANAMALFMGLVEPQNKKAVTNALVKDIRDRNNALTAGDIGYRYVLKALEESGRSDIIFDMNNRDDVPGYGFQLKHGATALTESWQAYESVSNNHFMLGHLMEWFYAGLAGIKQAENSVAYKHVIIEPAVVGDITSAKATHHSPYGEIKSEWIRDGNLFQLNIAIPANTTATVYLPSIRSSVITLDNKKVTPLANNKGRRQLTLGSGEYSISIKN